MPKVLYIGFGIFPLMQGGAIIYQESLAERIREMGWETVCFFGMPVSDYTFKNKPYLGVRYVNGIKFIEFYNSPNKVGYYINPEQQCLDAYIDSLTKRVLDEERPDIVHIHELQMHTASTIEVIRKNRIPVLKTIHNYFDICPQRDLLFQAKEICLDYREGERCVECLKSLPIKKEAPFIKKILWHCMPRRLYEDLSIFYGKIKPLHGKGAPDIRQTYYAYQYAKRRKFFVEMLNRLDILHCSSHRSAELLTRYGVLKDKIRVIPISVKNIEKIHPKPLRDTRLPVVFGYMGGEHLSKGYEILIDAFLRLNQAKAKLIIWGMPKSERLAPSPAIEFRWRYQHNDINEVLKEIDIGVVPSVWEEVFGIIGIEFLAARIPVIGSNIGGIPEWLKDKENGFLVYPADTEELVQKMQLFIENPELIAQMQENIKPQKTLNEHAVEIINFYKEIISRRKTTEG
ncbi:MAG: glycosyltransferase [Candidatus Omnitrophica bacterium]|nr:glycosyltransferase [Candidatus Omnitrophota bacterium]